MRSNDRLGAIDLTFHSTDARGILRCTHGAPWPLPIYRDANARNPRIHVR
jgi:hypothetical protein